MSPKKSYLKLQKIYGLSIASLSLVTLSITIYLEYLMGFQLFVIIFTSILSICFVILGIGISLEDDPKKEVLIIPIIALIIGIPMFYYGVLKDYNIFRNYEQYYIQIKSNDVNKRIEAANNLGNLLWDNRKVNNINIIKVLCKSLADNNSDVRYKIVEAIANSKSIEAIDCLSTAIGDNNIKVRKEAIRGLRWLKDNRVLNQLQLALDDNNQEVREAAEEALRHLGFATSETKKARATNYSESLLFKFNFNNTSCNDFCNAVQADLLQWEKEAPNDVKKDIAIIEKFLNDRNAYSQDDATESAIKLAKHKAIAKGAIKVLIKSLYSENSYILYSRDIPMIGQLNYKFAQYSAYALVSISRPAVPALICNYNNEPSYKPLARAVKAWTSTCLSIITGQELEQNCDSWKNWLFKQEKIIYVNSDAPAVRQNDVDKLKKGRFELRLGNF